MRGMPVARVVITKESNFQGKPERWSNGYHFDSSLNPATEADMQSLCASVIAWERTHHATSVKFVYALGGVPGQPSVYVEEFAAPLSGSTQASIVHPETCVLFESKRRRKVYFRKWMHTRCYSGRDATNPDWMAQATIDFLNSVGVHLTDGTLAGGAIYCTPGGAHATVPFTVDPYLRTHQFRARAPRRPPVTSP